LWCYTVTSGLVTCDIVMWHFSHTPSLCSKSKKKRNINNDLVVLPSHDIAIIVKYISSIGNQMGTLSSSPCQLRLGVDLSQKVTTK